MRRQEAKGDGGRGGEEPHLAEPCVHIDGIVGATVGAPGFCAWEGLNLVQEDKQLLGQFQALCGVALLAGILGQFLQPVAHKSDVLLEQMVVGVERADAVVGEGLGKILVHALHETKNGVLATVPFQGNGTDEHAEGGKVSKQGEDRVPGA